MKVLIITYYWPPSGGSGVQRWMYFAKYLGEFGIEPVVVTVDEKYASYPSTDKTLNEKVKHVRVFRTKTLEPIRFYSFLKSGNSQKEIPQGNVGGTKKGIIDKIATYVRANFFIPDARVGWNRYAYAQAAALLKSEDFKAVITTGPPHSTHLVGQKLKQRFGIRWIADFRDPWTEVYYNEIFKRTKRNAKKDKALEQRVLQESDLILTVGPSMKALVAAKIPGQEDKVRYIYNGYDAEKLEDVVRTSNQFFTISYVGILNSNYPYLSFIEALTACMENNPDWKITLNLVGKIDADVLHAFESIPGIQLVKMGNVSINKAAELTANADLLLLVLPMNESSKIIVSGKIMEYIASGSPILAIINPESDAADLVTKYANGAVFHPSRTVEISNYIARMKAGDLPGNSVKPDFSTFERKNTAKMLASLLMDLTKKN